MEILCTILQIFCKKTTLLNFFLLSPLPFKIVSEVLYTAISQEKKEKLILTGNEVKISLFPYGMILYIKQKFQSIHKKKILKVMNSAKLKGST